MRNVVSRAVAAGILAAAGLCAMAETASAQYYQGQQGGYYIPPQGGYRPPPPPPGYYRPDPYRQPNPYGGYGGYGGGYQPRPVIFGNICYTSRGSCQTRPRPAETPCSCIIPGFGPKRGAVVAGGY
jgi:hypothetical protein